MGDENNDRRTVAVPSQLRDVMIVPNARVSLPTGKDSFALLEQNWIFGQQWKLPTPRGDFDGVPVTYDTVHQLIPALFMEHALEHSRFQDP